LDGDGGLIYVQSSRKLKCKTKTTKGEFSRALDSDDEISDDDTAVAETAYY